jgi:ABC-type antimicrobial peptide transport system permease subunit
MLGHGLRTTLVGAGMGLLGAAYLLYFLTQKLPAFGGSDFRPIVVAVTLLLGTAAFACWLPSRRATRISPMEALRAE